MQVTAIAHIGVAGATYRAPLIEIAASGLVDKVPDRGDRATAFWFTMAGPTLWLGGRLLRSAEESGDTGAQQAAGTVLTATGLVGAAAMPKRGLWALLASGVAVLRRARAGLTVRRRVEQ